MVIESQSRKHEANFSLAIMAEPEHDFDGTKIYFILLTELTILNFKLSHRIMDD